MPRFPRPSYGKKDVSLIDLYKQKLKAKLVDILVERTVKTPEDRNFAFAIFASQIFEVRPESDDSEEFSKFMSRMKGQF